MTEAGVPVEELRRDDPGEVIWRDDQQVVAKPPPKHPSGDLNMGWATRPPYGMRWDGISSSLREVTGTLVRFRCRRNPMNWGGILDRGVL